MMLWDLIRDFFVQYIFGGITSNDVAYFGSIGSGLTVGDISPSIYDVYLNLGDYFSLIATVITLVIILLVIGHFIKKLFNLFGRII